MQAEAKDNLDRTIRVNNTNNGSGMDTTNTNNSRSSRSIGTNEMVQGTGPCQVSFDVTLLDQTVAMFGLRAQRKFAGACAHALGVHANQVHLESVRAGSIVVTTRVSGLADDAAASAVVASVADPAKLSAGLSALGLGRSAVCSSPVLELPDSRPAASNWAAAAAPPPRPARQFERQSVSRSNTIQVGSKAVPVEMAVEDDARTSAPVAQEKTSKQPVPAGTATAAATTTRTQHVEMPANAQRNVRHHTLPTPTSALAESAAATDQNESNPALSNSSSSSSSPLSSSSQTPSERWHAATAKALDANPPRGQRGRVRASSLFDLVAKYEKKSASLPPNTSSSSQKHSSHSRQQRSWSSSSPSSSSSSTIRPSSPGSATSSSSSISRRAPFLPRAVSLGSAATGAMVKSESMAWSSSSSRAVPAVSAVARLRLGGKSGKSAAPLTAVERLRLGVAGQQNNSKLQNNGDQKVTAIRGAAAAKSKKINKGSTDKHVANYKVPPAVDDQSFSLKSAPKSDNSISGHETACELSGSAASHAEPVEPTGLASSTAHAVAPAAAPAAGATPTATAADPTTGTTDIPTAEAAAAVGSAARAATTATTAVPAPAPAEESKALPLRGAAKRATSMSLAPRWATVAASSQTSSIRAKSLDRVAADTLYAEAQMHAAASAATGSCCTEDDGAPPGSAAKKSAQIPSLQDASLNGARGRSRFGSLQKPSSSAAAAAESTPSADAPARSASLSSVLVPAPSVPMSRSPTPQPLSSPTATLATRLKRSSLVASIAARFAGSSAPSPDRTPGNLIGTSSTSTSTSSNNSNTSSSSNSRRSSSSTSSPSTSSFLPDRRGMSLDRSITSGSSSTASADSNSLERNNDGAVNSSSSLPDRRGMSLDRSTTSGSSSTASADSSSLERNNDGAVNSSFSKKRVLSNDDVMAENNNHASSGNHSRVQALRAKFSRSTPAATASTVPLAVDAEVASGTAADSPSTAFKGGSKLDGALFQPSPLVGAVAEDEEDAAALVDENEGAAVENARRVRLLSRARTLGPTTHPSSDHDSSTRSSSARGQTKAPFPKLLTLTSTRSEDNGGGAASFAGTYRLNEGADATAAADTAGVLVHGLPTWSRHKKASVASADADAASPISEAAQPQEFVIYSDHKVFVQSLSTKIVL